MPAYKWPICTPILAPVEFIHETAVLNRPDFKDEWGNASIWERIKKVGETKFYRVNYDKNSKTGNELSKEQERIAQKQYVEGKGAELLISTHIATTPYIANVIDVYVHHKGNADLLYEEPQDSDKEKAG